MALPQVSTIAGHATGIDELPPGVTPKRLPLLKTAVPDASNIAVLSTTHGRGGHETQLEDAQQAASLRVSVKPYRAASRRELEGALAAIGDDRMDGLVNFQGGLSVINRQVIVDFATKHRVPAIYQATMLRVDGVGAGSGRTVSPRRVVCRSDSQSREPGRPPDQVSVRLLPRD
jgi:hypothetical protein